MSPVSGSVARLRSGSTTRRSVIPGLFYTSTLKGLLTSRPPRLAVQLDGKLWYEGHAYIVAIANGQTFGHGMRVAPNAVYNDGLFDVILVEGMPRTRIVMALNTVFSGSISCAPTFILRRHRLSNHQSRWADRPGTRRRKYERASTSFEILAGALNTLANTPALEDLYG